MWARGDKQPLAFGLMFIRGLPNWRQFGWPPAADWQFHGKPRDPFDRVLVAQALVEGVTLLTTNATVARYPAPVQEV
jgi:hypothetical protein